MNQWYAHHYPESLRGGALALDENYHIFIAEQRKGAASVDATP
jgi:hypothetical protein